MGWLCFFLTSQWSSVDYTASSACYLPSTYVGRKNSYVVWAELNDTNLRFEWLSSLFFLTVDVYCGMTIFVSDIFQFHVYKMELIFLCFRGIFWDDSVYYTSGTVWAPMASLEESGENIDQTLLLVFFSPWIKKYKFVPVFIHLCSYPSLSSTRLICGFSSFTWDFYFGRHLRSDNFFLTFGQGKKMTQTNEFPCYSEPQPQMSSRAVIFQPSSAGLRFLLFPWLNWYHFLWQSWEFRSSAKTEVMYVSTGLIWEFYVTC